MKKVLKSLLIVALVAFFNNAAFAGGEALTHANSDVEYIEFGNCSFSVDKAVPANELIAFMGKRDSIEVIVSGSVAEVCQKKGCWMSVDLGNGKSMHVSYDYEFLLPLNCGGKEMVMNGYAYYDVIPVSHLKHLAEDAGKSQAEIDKITEPKATLAFLATGVMIKK